MPRSVRILTLSCVFAAALLVVPQVRAESDFEYAKVLLDSVNSPSFSTYDLVERLAARLDDSPTGKSEAQLIRANLKRRQADDLTAEKRVAILKDAAELAKDAASDKKFRLSDTARKDSLIINKLVYRAAIDAAKNNPAEAQRLRGEAAKLIEVDANTYKAEAEAAYPIFQAAYKVYTDWKAKNDTKDEGKMPGADVMGPLEKSFDIWIIADKKYVASKSEQIEMLDEADKKVREALGKEMAEHCKKRAEDDVISNFPVIASWYSFMQGRIYASIGNEEEASRSWNEALGVEAKELGDDLKKQFFAIRRQIVHDLIKMKMKSKKYSEVEEIYGQIKIDPLLRQLLDEDAGKELIVDYANALTLPDEATAGEYEKAIRALREASLRDHSQQWQNTFARAMAEILVRARDAGNINPHLTAPEWYDAARGFHLMGRYIYTQQYERMLKSTDPAEAKQAPAKFDEAYKEYSNAVDYYRRAISEARRSDRTDLATRLEIEPKAWFEMGLSYMRMKHDYEAIIAYKAMRDSFLPNFRAKWLPDPAKDPKAYTPYVKAALTKLDLPKEKEGLLAKAGVNVLIALDENEKTHKDPWNQGLRPKIISGETSPLDPEGVNDKDYIVADGDAKQARSFSDEARRNADNPAVSAELWSRAQQNFLSAAEKFAKVKAESSAYDYALVNTANNYTQAQRIIVEGHGAEKDPAKNAAAAKDLADKALAAYEKYDQFESAHATTDEKVIARRKLFRGAILLARNSLYLGNGEYEKAVQTADAYLTFEQENPPPGGKSSAKVAYLNKFHAYLGLAAKNPAPTNEEFLKGSLQALHDLRAVDNKDNKLYEYMLSALSDRYNISAFQLEAKKKEPSLSKTDIEALDEKISTMEKKVADLQLERIKQQEAGGKDELNLNDYSRLVYLLHRAGYTQAAADMAFKLVTKFDPKGKNLTIPDDEASWKPILDSMLRVISYPEIDKDTRCKNEHKILVDYMYDTAAGAQLPENDPRRPAGDKLNANMEKALAKVESIKNPAGEFKDCQTLRLMPPGEKRTFMQIIEDEIQFRRKIVAARDLLSDMALEVADKLKKDGKDEASNKYFEIAQQQIKSLTDIYGDSPSIELKLAEIDIALGKTNQAMNRLIALKNSLAPESQLYFQASRKISELYFAQKKFAEAADYPSTVALILGFNSKIVKEHWPAMHDFLKECYDNGVPIPKALKAKFEAKPEGETPAAPETKAPEAPKTEAAPETKPSATPAPAAPKP